MLKTECADVKCQVRAPTSCGPTVQLTRGSALFLAVTARDVEVLRHAVEELESARRIFEAWTLPTPVGSPVSVPYPD